MQSFEFQVSDVDLHSSKRNRLDAFLATKLPNASRARLQTSIKKGFVRVNGSDKVKSSQQLRPGDKVSCTVVPPPPLEALPEELPLDIVFEDDDLIVINKSADMVMHPSPGHYSGTLVNALLHHCGLPPVRVDPSAEYDSAKEAPKPLDASKDSSKIGTIPFAIESEQVIGSSNLSNQKNEIESDYSEDDDDIVFSSLALSANSPVSKPNRFQGTENAGKASEMIIRPGIVHRLDKGTTGLVIVAKSDRALFSLSRQFKDRTISRIYTSLTVGIPSPSEGTVLTNIGRDFRDRKRMAAFAYGSTRGRTAKSAYKVCEELADGRAAMVEWKLETGRTHQIRVHAKHIGHSLIGDEVYSGTGNGTINRLTGNGRQKPTQVISSIRNLLSEFKRPALHAKTLGFYHPNGEWMSFESDLPMDFEAALQVLRDISR